MEISKIKESCLYVTDLVESKDFYHGKLGFKVIGEVRDRHVFFRAGSSVLLCFLPEVSSQGGNLPPHYGTGHLHLAFEVKREAYEPWKERIRELGIPIEQEFDWGASFLSFYFRDPDQHLLEVVMEGMWERGK